MIECAVLVGLPGAGKTTFFEEWLAATHVHVSMDRFPSARDKARRQEREILEALRAGRSVAVDNTNPTIAGRAPIIAAARACGATIVGYYVESTTRGAVARNALRTGKAKVPNVAIFTTARRLEPPTLGEGFDRLYRVRGQPGRTFIVEPWESERLRPVDPAGDG